MISIFLLRTVAETDVTRKILPFSPIEKDEGRKKLTSFRSPLPVTR